MDSLLGEAVRRGRGETERGWTSCIHCAKAEFGVFVSHCTVTSGGAPSARMDDAVSSIVLSAAAGELTLTDCSGECSDGEDIFTANFSLSKHPVTLNCLFLPHTQQSALHFLTLLQMLA